MFKTIDIIKGGGFSSYLAIPSPQLEPEAVLFHLDLHPQLNPKVVFLQLDLHSQVQIRLISLGTTFNNNRIIGEEDAIFFPISLCFEKKSMQCLHASCLKCMTNRNTKLTSKFKHFNQQKQFN